MKKQTIGILGGMGPEASCYLYKKIITHYQQVYKAVQDTDYPHLIINSICLEGFSEKGVEDPLEVQKQLLEGIQQLERAGANMILMACNSVHEYYQYLQEKSQGIIVNLIEEVVKTLQKDGIQDVLILSSDSTRTSGLYDRYLEQYGVRFTKLSNREQSRIDNIIKHIMENTLDIEDTIFMEELVEKYHNGAILLACTELPIAFEWWQDERKYDTISILTQLVDEKNSGNR